MPDKDLQAEIERARTRPGATLGHFVLLAELGRGGMGVVHRAWHERLKKVVALKTLLPGSDADRAAIRRFYREAEAIGRLRHPSIVSVLDVGEIDETHYLAMDYVQGTTLERRLSRESRERLPFRVGVEIVRDVALAVQYAHEQGVIHRDLKPSNIMLDENGAPFVLDFGLARLAGEASKLTGTGIALGTPAYMPPEQAGERGDVTARSDVWALGATLYHVVCGRPPFHGMSALQVIAAVCDKDPVPPSTLNRQVSGDLETIILRCLEKDPAKRYPSSGAFAQDLTRWLDGGAIYARKRGPVESAARFVRKNAVAASITAAASMTALAIVIAIIVATDRSLERAQLAAERAKLEAEKERAAKDREDAEKARAEVARREEEAKRREADLSEQERKRETLARQEEEARRRAADPERAVPRTTARLDKLDFFVAAKPGGKSKKEESPTPDEGEKASSEKPDARVGYPPFPAEYHAAMLPRGEEAAWAALPWRRDLDFARSGSGEDDKPLLVWVARGDPLGVTDGAAIAHRIALGDPTAFAMVRDGFVPIALDARVARARKPWAEFIDKLIEQLPPGESGARSVLLCATARGKLVSWTTDGDPKKVVECLGKALAKWDSVADRKWKGAAKPGALPERPQHGLCFRVNARELERVKENGRQVVAVSAPRPGSSGRPSFDVMWTTFEENLELASTVLDTPRSRPGVPERLGLSRRLPAALVWRIARFHLVDATRGVPEPWSPAAVKKLELWTTERSSSTVANVVGAVTLEENGRGFDGVIWGEIECSSPTPPAEVERCDLVVLGEHWGESIGAPGARPGRSLLGFTFTLSPRQRDRRDQAIPTAVVDPTYYEGPPTSALKPASSPSEPGGPSTGPLEPPDKSSIPETVSALIAPAEEESGWATLPWANMADGWDDGGPLLLVETEGHPCGCTDAWGLEARSRALADPRVVALLKDKFKVIAADDWYRRRARELDQAVVMVERAAEETKRKGPREAPKTGFYCLSRRGKLLGFTDSTDPEKLLDVLQRALKKDAALSPSEREGAYFDRQDPSIRRRPSDSWYVLSVHARELERTDDGGWRRAPARAGSSGLASADSLWLTLEERRSLAGPFVAFGGDDYDWHKAAAKANERWRVPGALARRIARFHLVDATRGIPTPWPADSADAAISVRAASFFGDMITLELIGRFRCGDAKAGYEGELLGTAKWHAPSRSLRSLELTALGDHWGDTTGTATARPGRTPLGVLISYARHDSWVTVPHELAPPLGVRDLKDYGIAGK